MDKNQQQLIIRNALKSALHVHSNELHHQLKKAFSHIECKLKSNISLDEAIAIWLKEDFLHIINGIDLIDVNEKQQEINQIKQWLKVKDIIEQFQVEILKTI